MVSKTSVLEWHDRRKLLTSHHSRYRERERDRQTDRETEKEGKGSRNKIYTPRAHFQ
jgi:hypothetical protein